MTTIADKLQNVRTQLQQSSDRHGRAPGSVALLAVSKTFGPEAVLEAWAAGQRAFGENYIQEAVEKIGALSGHPDMVAGPIEWHCIGPIQSNKTRLVATHFDWVHTVDRLKIAQRLSDQRPPGLQPLQVCIQVNVDGGANKSGVPPGEAPELARQVARLPRVVLRGLMSIPEPTDDPVEQRRLHRLAHELFAAIAAGGLPDTARWDTLSMGMSADLDAAIAEGSTLVRVGTAIFGRRA